MRNLCLALLLILSIASFGQGADSLLQGKWELFKIIENMTGDELDITHKGTDDYTYWISFEGNTVRYNLEINKCNNEIVVGKKHTIEFKYYSECTEVCCDDEFSKLLSYPDCTNYYIKEKKTLILVSEDRIFYFKKVAP